MKYAAQPFMALNAADIELWADSLLLKINAITGWVVPDGDMQTVLADQFRKKILEAYRHTNPDEIEYAFRNFGTTVKDWGKSMNLSLIDEVMIPYLARRSELSKIEEQKVLELPNAPAPEADISEQAMLDWALELQNKISAGSISVSFLPLMVYDWLERTGRLFRGRKEKHEYLAKAIEYRQGELKEAFETGDLVHRQRLSDFMDMKEARLFRDETAEQLRFLAKKMILWDFLKDEYQP